MNRVVLFDMDGTLTPPRKAIEESMEDALHKLSQVTKVGIVTGSDFDYVKQQCGSFLYSGKDLSNFFILPCNGTKKYVLRQCSEGTSEWIQESALNMREHLGESNFRKLMFLLCERLYITHMTSPGKVPAAGNFISYRGSLINWCPIGRSATENDRLEFIELDKKEKIRQRNLDVLSRTSWSDFLSFSMGGNTSIDIYPTGWDKTYALNHFVNHEHWFVGDRCTMESGNDKPLYDKIRETEPGKAFEVKSTADTLKIIEELLGKWYVE
tara:strand:+ start:408 stop:1211 length:804 start_codon:yes stop_codon:yes gene_type:complete